MARAAAKGGKRPQPDARRDRSGGHGRRQLSAAEQTLFFSRIRRQTKWVFVVLALVFAGGFVFFGVGSGNQGSIGDLFSNAFHGGSSGPSIADAQKRVEKNPQDAQAYRDLATALQDKGRTDEAVNVLAKYTSLRPKDAKALADLGTLQRTQAQNLQSEAGLAQYIEQQAFADQTFAPPSTTPLGRALGQDPIQSAVQSQVSSRSSDATNRAIAAYDQAIGTYQRLAKLRPNDATVQLDLAQTAESANNTKVEIAALQRAAKLLPDQAGEIRARIKELRASSPTG